jgi:predicted TIM-barrel fold metal-dependent hydrolase
VPRGKKDAEAFAHLDDLVALAACPNVAVKATSLSYYTSEPYPHRGVHAHFRKVLDAFGPKRVFWGSDLTKLAPGTYRQLVTLFTEEMPWLSESDKEWIMGRGVCEWLRWEHPRLKGR